MHKLVIHKFVVEPSEAPEVQMPRSARVLDVQMQPQPDGGAALCIWALVLKGDVPQPRAVKIVATGEDLEADVVEKFDHLSTLQTLEPRVGPEGIVPKSIVHHVFLERPPIN